MCYFEAHYIDIYDGTEITKKICFDEQLFDTVKECYLHAMSEAYDMTGENEMFASLDFIAF